MLVPFVIDADSLQPDPGWTPSQTRRAHDALLELWEQLGLLGYDAASFEGSRLHLAIERLPQKLRPLWQEMARRAPMFCCDKVRGESWDGVVNRKEIGSLSRAARLALVDDERAEAEFEIPETDFSASVGAPPSSIEVCRVHAADRSTTVARARHFSGIHIEPGESYRDIWESRFRYLAEAPIKRIAVVDRYAVSRHIECPQHMLSGLERFLRLLDETSDGTKHVTVYAGWTEALRDKAIGDVAPELTAVVGRLPHRRVRLDKLFMASNSHFGDVAHDRFVRFGDYAWDIGVGISVLEGPACSERSSASFKTRNHIEGYKNVEDELAKHKDTKKWEF